MHIPLAGIPLYAIFKDLQINKDLHGSRFISVDVSQEIGLHATFSAQDLADIDLHITWVNAKHQASPNDIWPATYSPFEVPDRIQKKIQPWPDHTLWTSNQ